MSQMGHVSEYPIICIMHYFGNSGHIQSMIAHMSLTEYFWKFRWKNCIVGMSWTCLIKGHVFNVPSIISH